VNASAADELQRALRAAEADILTVPEAARESGYSADRLKELIREGKIPNAGRKHAPRIRRGDLPRKPRAQPVESSTGGASLACIERDFIATRTRGRGASGDTDRPSRRRSDARIEQIKRQAAATRRPR
jgi:hypothetical protein